ncbi:hypothetical protein SISSUDRAFT_983884 [Sistotremastrum suecicum HHB10207 ss-3]|uniref:ARM repeat-containing protein n=1 Tax=Sistotremastrum suecicum HHB10207 ss-3 TaxID=1314776 RepID=A0A166EZF1_9AGAM|nr:hypothetical protein SISSUDRAFT_983884 [Sistotremastrum suecicum HHB10207 ss-3]
MTDPLDLGTLSLHDISSESKISPVPDFLRSDDPQFERLKSYANALPYSIESNAHMQDLLDHYLLRMTECVKAQSFDPGFLQWDSMVNYWIMLKYPMPKEKRTALAKLYFEICVTPGMPMHVVATGVDGLQLLTHSKKKLSIKDMRLPWKSIYVILKKDLFLSRRQFEISQVPFYLGTVAESSRRFFHPACIPEMLDEFIPGLNGCSLNSILSTQYYLLTFLPLSHPQLYLPALFQLWDAINSYIYDERMIAFLAELAEVHVDPSSGLARNASGDWTGLWKDVGIFNEAEWNTIMCKTLASMEIPLADAGSLATGSTTDTQSGFEIGRLPKPNWRIYSLAKLIVYSMFRDGPVTPSSGTATPFVPDIHSTPTLGTANTVRSYLAGSRALDSLARLVVSLENFFHPSNSGSWTSDLSAFLRYIAYEFSKRWHDEKQPTCNTPHARRLTTAMKNELVLCLRTSTLLGMFSNDSQTAANIQSCMKWLTILQPDLILPAILERAIPSLETLTETQRTPAMIRALGAVSPALVCRHVSQAGGPYLVQILDLLVPGVDLNDPGKTLCTTDFLVEAAQYIKFANIADEEFPYAVTDDTYGHVPASASPTPMVTVESFLDDGQSEEPKISTAEADEMLRISTMGFADWATSFFRRVLLLLENLPDEGLGSRSGETEVQVVDAVTQACSQICVHLSDELFDLVLNLIFDYASTNVRNNAVRAIHALLESVSNAHPAKTLAKFLPFCLRSIRTELENGASSIRSTSASTSATSDAALHWNLAIMRGAMYNDGTAILPYKEELLEVLKTLHAKTLSKRGFSWTGKLLSSILLTLTHTYPLENKFVNQDTWDSDEFRKAHYLFWGKQYSAADCKIAWHVPNSQETQFAITLFTELVEPALERLEALLQDGVRDDVWRNDFCRHLSLVRNGFAGIPTFLRDDQRVGSHEHATQTSDIMNEIPEFIAEIEPLSCGFVLAERTDPRWQTMIAIKRRFGKFLHASSTLLQEQEGEKTVDVVHMIIRSMRTFLLEYGDSHDSYYTQRDQYTSDITRVRQVPNQRVWPRAIFLRRARYYIRLYHAARLRWNSIERHRSTLENELIDDLLEWSMWSYASGTNSWDSHSLSYDGVRRRSLPRLLAALEPGTENDKTKGALYTLKMPVFSRYVMNEPTVAMEFLEKLFGCQYNEKASSMLQTNVPIGLSSFPEPSSLVYELQHDRLMKSADALKSLLRSSDNSVLLIEKGRKARISRQTVIDRSIEKMTQMITQNASDPQMHWRYSIIAIRCLRTLIRRDRPVSFAQMRYFMEMTCDDHPSMYAQRAVMKSLRYLKLRSFSSTAVDRAKYQCRNPLRKTVLIKRTPEFTTTYLEGFKQPLDCSRAAKEPCLQDKVDSGWLAWREQVDFFLFPAETYSPFETWHPDSSSIIDAVKEVASRPSYWERLSTHFAEENHSDTANLDNISCVKSIFQVLKEQPLDTLKPILLDLLSHADQNKQRSAAELLGGIIGGSKHWSQSAQTRLWAWLTPLIPKMLDENVKTDTVPVWTSFLEYIIENKDPRRVQPLIDYLVNQFSEMDCNGESSFNAVRIGCYFRCLSEELLWRFRPWSEIVISKYWPEIACDHDEVRAWTPKPSLPTPEVFVRECREEPVGDVMGIRSAYHLPRIMVLVDQFPIWRQDRLPGTRAFQSTYDKVGIMVCKWLLSAIYDIQAIMAFDYILPLMPELFRFSEVNDNDELEARADLLLNRMCGVSPPRALIAPILDSVFNAIRTSTSWKVRTKALPLVQVWYFRQFPLITEERIMRMLEVCCECLNDEIVEVREMAATTLSGILRCSPRRSILSLKERFVRQIRAIRLPPRQSAEYNSSLRSLHGGILGVCALIDSFPHTVEKWTPELLIDVLGEHIYDPAPVSSAIRSCASNFKRTHQDTWHEDSKRFNEEQLASLSTILTGSSYCTL